MSMFIFTKSGFEFLILHVKGITTLFKGQQVFRDKILVYA